MEQFTYKIGTDRQLFVDDYLVAETRRLKKTLHQPTKHSDNPLIVAAEGEKSPKDDIHPYGIYFQGSIVFDPEDELYKIWYGSYGYRYCYAFSRDGFEFTKPDLDVFDTQQPRNMVYWGAFPHEWIRDRYIVMQTVSVVLDEHCKNPDERFKLMCFQAAARQRPASFASSIHTAEATPDEIRQQVPSGCYTAVSADGIHWRPNRTPVLSKADDPLMSDTITLNYDPLKNRFMAFTKRHIVRGDGTGDQDTIQRARGISFSEDFVHWTRPISILYADDQDPRDMQFYRMNGWTYEGMYLGMIEAYHSSHTNPDKPLYRDVQLVSSRDCEHWFRSGNRQTFLPVGGPGTWDAYMLDTPSNGPFVKGDELWFYYGGRPKHHNYQPGYFMTDDRENAAIGLAVLRRDGYVSYDADAEAGTLLTKPFTFEQGRALHLNADARRGAIRVEVLTAEEDPKAELRMWGIKYGAAVKDFETETCQALTQDQADHTLAWKNGEDISSLKGRLIALRFHMQQASLFSWWITS